MPDNWATWSAAAGIPGAARTLANQERVVLDQIQRYVTNGYSPQDIAAIWYSGHPLGDNADSPQGGGKYPTIRQYTQSILQKLGQPTEDTLTLTRRAPSVGAYNGRTETAAGTGRDTGEQVMPDTTQAKFPWRGFGTFAPPKAGATAVPKVGVGPNKTVTPPTPGVAGYKRTGNYTQDTQGYMTAAQAAWDALDAYAAKSGLPIERDEKSGLVYIYDGKNLDANGQDKGSVDRTGSLLLQQALSAEHALDGLVTARKAGIDSTGGGSAAAYLTSEQGQATESEKEYDDYIKRIGDITALEQVPLDRMSKTAGILSSINSANKNRQGKFDTMAFAPKPEAGTDTMGLAAGIKATLPSTPPVRHNIAPSVFSATVPQDSSPGANTAGKVPVPPPQGMQGDIGLAPPQVQYSDNSGYYEPSNTYSLTGMSPTGGQDYVPPDRSTKIKQYDDPVRRKIMELLTLSAGG